MVGTWKLLKSVAVGAGGADSIDTGELGSYDFLKVAIYLIPSGGSIHGFMYFNGDGVETGNYARRGCIDGGSNATTSGDFEVSPDHECNFTQQVNETISAFFAIANPASETGKQITGWEQEDGGSAEPSRIEWNFKYKTTGRITSIQVKNNLSGSSNFAEHSYITVWGSSDDTVTDEKTTITNVPTNTQYRETDTRKIYRRIVGNTTTTVSMATNAWTSTRSSSPYVASDGSELDYTLYNNSSTIGSAIHDLGSALSDTKWVARIHLNNSTVNNDSAFYISFTNTSGNVGTGSNADRIYFMVYKNSSTGFQLQSNVSGSNNFWTDGGSISLNNRSDTGVSTGDMYIEFTRQSATTGIIKVGSNSDYSSNTSYTIDNLPSTVAGLQYIQIGNSNHGTGGTGYTVIGSVKSIKVQDGVDSFSETRWVERGSA